MDAHYLAELQEKARNRRDQRIADAERNYGEDLASIQRVMRLMGSESEIAEPTASTGRIETPPPRLEGERSEGSERPPSLKDACKEVISARAPGATFTMQDIGADLAARFPALHAARATLSGTLLRLADEDRFMEIVDRGRGTRPSVYRVIPISRDHEA